MQDTASLWRAVEGFRPQEVPQGLIWAMQNIVNHLGRPYDHAAYPHLGAPGGPWDAFDAPSVRTIALQFGSRLSKTFFGTCCAFFLAANAPCPMMHANATEKLAKRVIERAYDMARQRPVLLELLASPAENDWRQVEIAFKACRLYGAWSRSVATLADQDVLYGHSSEIDKWEQASTSKEADPLTLFTDRFKNYWSSRKIIFESTPTVKGASRIEDKLQAGTDCRLHVPCPRCRRFQPLVFGKEDSAGGLRWDRDEAGRTDPATAFATARYVCRFCQAALSDHDRPWMIRRGVWVPRGCEVDDAIALEVATARLMPSPDRPKWQGWRSSPWVRGIPARGDTDQSYQLSSLYALSLGWGDIAQEWARSYRKPQFRRNFVNQWLAETWEPVVSRSTPQTVAARLGTNRAMGIVPTWGRFATVAIDRQAGAAGAGSFNVFVVAAHGEADRTAVIRHGIRATLDEIWQEVVCDNYFFEDGGGSLRPAIVVIDSSWATKATYEFCEGHERCFPIKGSDYDLGGEPYRIVTLGYGESRRVRSGAVGQMLIHVATDFWETDLQHRLDNTSADEPGGLSLNRDVAGDANFMAQLLNGTLEQGADRRGNARLLWVKCHEDEPNDFRDAVRYSLCAAKAWLDDRGGVMPVRAPVATAGPRAHFIPERRPDGREWI